jgi:hypothetical protein
MNAALPLLNLHIFTVSKKTASRLTFMEEKTKELRSIFFAIKNAFKGRDVFQSILSEVNGITSPVLPR